MDREIQTQQDMSNFYVPDIAFNADTVEYGEGDVENMKILTPEQCRQFTDVAVERLAEYVKSYNLKTLVMGISGGIDSGVVAVIALKTIQKLELEGVNIGYKFMFLNCESSQEDYEKAKSLADTFGFKLEYADLTPSYKVMPEHKFHKQFPQKTEAQKKKLNIARGNLKCRSRMIMFRDVANLTNGIYLDTDDKSEEWMGFWTIAGDEGDIKLTQEVTKTEMYDLATYYGLPDDNLASLPGDGLGVTKGNLASDQLGMEYLKIEYVMSRFIMSNFDYNGSFDQLENPGFIELIDEVADIVGEKKEAVVKVLTQSLKTSFKRMGKSVINLIEDRADIGFPIVGSQQFNDIYLRAIQQSE